MIETGIGLEDIEKALWEEAEKHPGPALTKKELAKLSKDSIGHISNMDSRGQGPEGSFFVGRKKLYLKKPAVEWIISRIRLNSISLNP